MEREDGNEHHGDLSARLSLRLMQEMAARNTVVEDGVLLNRLRMYEEVATWPLETRLTNLFVEAKALLDHDLLHQIGVIDQEDFALSFLSRDPALISGCFKDPNTQFMILVAYEDGSYVTRPEAALVEIERVENKWRPRPMRDEEFAVLKPSADRLTETMTLLLHESLRRQIGEFERFFEHVSAPGYVELARAQAENRLRSERTSRTLIDDEGLSFKVDWTMDVKSESRDAVVMGFIERPGGERVPFQVDKVVVIDPKTSREMWHVECADESVVDALQDFFPARIEDWDHSRIIIDRAAVASAIVNPEHPVHALRASIVEEEIRMSARTEAIKRERLDLDGLRVEGRSGR